jgi:hypothetical protein
MKYRMIKRQVDLLWYWMRERHAIFLRRKRGDPYPWTKDEHLQMYKFTNVFRELDKTTIDLHSRMDGLTKLPLHDRMYRIILFRSFNWTDTYDRIVAANAVDNFTRMISTLRKMRREELKIFTGAYIVTSQGISRPKHDMMTDALREIYKGRLDLWKTISAVGTMEFATKMISQQPMFGPFTGYEVACDLRWQRGMLDDASDVDSWANPGPGAVRGISRLVSGSPRPRVFSRREDYVRVMQDLLLASRDTLPGLGTESGMKIEMREIEHSLCEFDKYMRARNGEGRPRAIFHVWRKDQDKKAQTARSRQR